MVSNVSSTNQPPDFAARLLAWFDQHGRHDLPWQHPRTAYRVWISEIMLQQTQVSTVIPYFERFMQAFPDINTLANASSDAVLHQWTGLGYYARARNLHRAAQIIRDEYQGQFPHDYEQVLALPGIGRSTAGAILAQAYAQRFPILDGNVKRVLTRLHAITGWPGEKQVEQRLWDIATTCTPNARIADYTQAIMDLGATICTRGKPDCPHCPFQHDCAAYRQGTINAYPAAKPRKILPVRHTCMLLLTDTQQQVLLEQRPPAGIWGGLWSFPECPPEENAVDWCRTHLHMHIDDPQLLTPLRHTFSHFHLEITPLLARAMPVGIMDSEKYIWYNTHQPDARGLPAPVKNLLEQLREQPTKKAGVVT